MKKRTKIIIILSIVLFGLVFTFTKVKRITPLSWGHHKVNQPMFSDQAINGYDPVAYFKDNKGVPGATEHSYTWQNADWYFSSKENKKLFSKNPEKYAPAFGGYCSFAISKGFTANTDPDVFEIIEGKLYLFADKEMQSKWKENLQENLKICETNWH